MSRDRFLVDFREAQEFFAAAVQQTEARILAAPEDSGQRADLAELRSTYDYLAREAESLADRAAAFVAAMGEADRQTEYVVRLHYPEMARAVEERERAVATGAAGSA